MSLCDADSVVVVVEVWKPVMVIEDGGKSVVMLLVDRREEV